MLLTAILLPFTLTALVSGYNDPHCHQGRHVITHLFMWKWNDIAAECERFLGPNGYCGVQVSPPYEHVAVQNPWRPWWERFQPVSYKLVSRSGSEGEFRSMINRCNNAGVRIYPNVVYNHMAGNGRSGCGTAGSYFDATIPRFDGVPYIGIDFNHDDVCHTPDLQIHNYGNVDEVRNCRLLGLLDLKLGNEYVRGKVVDFLNSMIDMGVAGFRVDASKHMWPGDIGAIQGLCNNLNSHYFGGGQRPFFMHEVIDYGTDPIRANEYTGLGRVTLFPYGSKLAEVFQGQWPIKNLRSIGDSWGALLNTFNAITFIDNHANQRGHGAAGDVLTNRQPRLYKAATAFMLAHPYGMPRIMSSYQFSICNLECSFQNSSYNTMEDWNGPPANGDQSIKGVPINGDGTCGDGWICEHRWRQIFNMVAWRNVATGADSVDNWWDNGNRQMAFGRGNRAFIVFALEGEVNQNLQTGLSGGTYCDVISGHLSSDRCTGKSVQVGGDGNAHFSVSSGWEDPMFAIHIGAKVGSTERRIG